MMQEVNKVTIDMMKDKEYYKAKRKEIQRKYNVKYITQGKILKNYKQRRIKRFDQKVAEKKERIQVLNKPIEAITPKDACKVMQCDPSVHYFEELCKTTPILIDNDNLFKWKMIIKDQAKIKQSIICLNKALFKLNLIRGYSIIISCAIYLYYANLHYRKKKPKITQEFIAKIFGITTVPMRNVLKRLNLQEMGI